jgi:hypothetical protein
VNGGGAQEASRHADTTATSAKGRMRLPADRAVIALPAGLGPLLGDLRFCWAPLPVALRVVLPLLALLPPVLLLPVAAALLSFERAASERSPVRRCYP